MRSEIIYFLLRLRDNNEKPNPPKNDDTISLGEHLESITQKYTRDFILHALNGSCGGA
jgi:hypothetical protein